jgi:hypothetical protein
MEILRMQGTVSQRACRNGAVFGREQYTKAGGLIAYLLTDRAKTGGMIAYLLTESALGTGGSHFVSIDLPPNTDAAVTLS